MLSKRSNLGRLAWAVVSASLFSGPSAIAEVEGLGVVDFPISCEADAQTEFTDGVILLHHMMYVQAEAAFVRAANADPACAMAQWGVAVSNFHPLWPGQPSVEETARGQAAAERMSELRPGTEREAAYVAAATEFYAAAESGYPAQLAIWADAQHTVFSHFPDDVDAGAFAALARLSTAQNSDPMLSEQRAAGALLEELYVRSPRHPGVIHYAIHAFDHPPLARQGEPFARVYDAMAPDVPHALHMPSHIFVRLGLWDETIDWNRRSAAAALAQPMGDATSGHYAHALDYLIYAHLQLGELEIAEQLLETFLAVDRIQDNFGTAYAFSTAPGRVALEQEDWSRAAILPEMPHHSVSWERFPQTLANVWFAKGIGAARSGDPASARAAQDELIILQSQAEASGGGYWAELINAQASTVAAWALFAEGEERAALDLMQFAADLEDRLGKQPVTPGHVLPARELLGDMLMQLGRPDAARTAYQESLTLSPNRRRSLEGLEASVASMGTGFALPQ